MYVKPTKEAILSVTGMTCENNITNVRTCVFFIMLIGAFL